MLLSDCCLIAVFGRLASVLNINSIDLFLVAIYGVTLKSPIKFSRKWVLEDTMLKLMFPVIWITSSQGH